MISLLWTRYFPLLLLKCTGVVSGSGRIYFNLPLGPGSVRNGYGFETLVLKTKASALITCESFAYFQCCGSGLIIPDPFNPKKWFLSSRKYDPGLFISDPYPDPDPDFCPSRIRGAKPQKGTGSRIRIRNTANFHYIHLQYVVHARKTYLFRNGTGTGYHNDGKKNSHPIMGWEFFLRILINVVSVPYLTVMLFRCFRRTHQELAPTFLHSQGWRPVSR